jgi:hypothetical protein
MRFLWRGLRVRSSRAGSELFSLPRAYPPRSA